MMSTDSDPVHQCDLRKYLQGHMLHKYFRLFEDGVNQFVKSCMQEAFPDIPTDPMATRFLEKMATRRSERSCKINELKSKIAWQQENKLNKLITDVGTRQKAQDKIERFSRDLDRLQQQNDIDSEQRPPPRWIRECHKA
eukprot:m.235584 g.235584  ORF g.235584 m.235584 type:complete len:139 (+) comp19343_c0_seq1:173-589(+)